MDYQILILQGEAAVISRDLRCQAPRVNDGIRKLCEKLLARLNVSGQIAGVFECRRCGQIVEVESRSLRLRPKR